MKFNHQQHEQVTLLGNLTLVRPSISSRLLQNLSDIDFCALIWSPVNNPHPEMNRALQWTTTRGAPYFTPTLPGHVRKTNRDPSLANPRPPNPSLLSGAKPGSARPYRYNFTQKNEMEMMVKEILTLGII